PAYCLIVHGFCTYILVYGPRRKGVVPAEKLSCSASFISSSVYKLLTPICSAVSHILSSASGGNNESVPLYFIFEKSFLIIFYNSTFFSYDEPRRIDRKGLVPVLFSPVSSSEKSGSIFSFVFMYLFTPISTRSPSF